MFVKNDLVADETAIEQETETERAGIEPTGPDDLLSLLSKFLESPGNVLLVRGPPGAGKTTLAFELLKKTKGPRIGRHMIPPNKVYVSSRVSPTKLRKHFPWINEVVDSMSGRVARQNWTESSQDLLVTETDNILSKVVAAKRSKQRGLLVIDSWEGALRNTPESGRLALESNILSEPGESMVGVILVSEDGELGLAHLVDGIVTLSSSLLEGKRIRTISINKLRGLRVQTHQALFSLDEGRFNILPQAEFLVPAASSPRILAAIPDSEHSFSTGNSDLDKMLSGGIKKGSSLLIDIDNSVSPEAVRLLLNMFRANFVNQGGACFIIPLGTFSSESEAESLIPLVGNKSFGERVRTGEYNQELPAAEWRVHLKGKLIEDLSQFDSSWKELGTISQSRMLTADIDKVVQVYGEDLTLPGLSEIGASVRDSRALSIGVASRPTKVREDFLRIADYHLKLKSIDGSLVMYGMKPSTNIHGISFSFEKGLPLVKLTEVV
ncbi:MAG TPA: ATPase domain-containing protein [Candidatus Bathyarchaeia archaeon]|nr:ATPase domain-containing protein [Candidatus Bathyarchaeia archaeon]